LGCASVAPTAAIEASQGTLSATPLSDATPERYLDGDVFIDDNVAYSSLGTSVDDLTNYRLFVKGNIYIKGSVHQLDGMYVALGADGKGGNIYTCASGIGAPATLTLVGNCEDQLVVNGSFVAKRVFLLRDCGSLKYADNTTERTVYSGAAGEKEQCSTVANTPHASEIFNFSPDMWLSAKDTKTFSGYDAISRMPPIL
jgi:hypothetical protein